MADSAAPIASATESVPVKKTVKKKKSDNTNTNPTSKPADSGFGSTENVTSTPGESGARRSSSIKVESNEQSTNNNSSGDTNNETTSSSRRGSQQSPPQRTGSIVAEPTSPTIAEEQMENSISSNIKNSENEKVTSSERRKSSNINSDLPMNVDPNADKVSREELINYRLACDSLLKDLQDRLSHEEDAAQSLSSNKKKLEGDISNLKKDIENLELALQKVI